MLRLPYRGIPVVFLVMFGLIGAVPSFAQGIAAPHQVLIDFNHVWRFYDHPAPPPADWMSRDFDDANWPEGPAPLGYDTADRRGNWPAPGIRTELAENRLTYLFRTSFEYDGPMENFILRLDHVVDDGAVFYLNGQEIGRTRMPEDEPITFGMISPVTIGIPSVEEDVFSIDSDLLRRGENVLAISLHNRSASSSDICLNVRLTVYEGTRAPLAMYLTWQRDPTTTMTIQWHEERHAEDGGVALEYGRVGDDDYRVSKPVIHDMVFTGRPIHTVELTGLESDATYWFRIRRHGWGEHSPRYRFRTMPAELDRPLRIVIGGDTMHQRDWFEQMNREALRFDPDFIIWGGDLAYADGREDRVGRWEAWFDACMNTLIRDDGRVVPIIVGIGNHEVQGGYYWAQERGRDAFEPTEAFRAGIAPYFYNLFAFPGQPGYGTLDFGDYLSVILLDTDHTNPVEGAQTQWLATQLAARSNVPHVLPVLHVAGYPSVRDFEGGTQRRVREHWSPLFDQFDVRLVFENHDHTYKRTVPLRAGRHDPTGVVYLGDGSWGVTPRQARLGEEMWYLERTESTFHMMLLTIHGEHQDVKVFDMDGELLDHLISRPRRRDTILQPAGAGER